MINKRKTISFIQTVAESHGQTSTGITEGKDLIKQSIEKSSKETVDFSKRSRAVPLYNNRLFATKNRYFNKSGCIAPAIGSTVHITNLQTNKISSAFNNIKVAVVNRATVYINNNAPSRAGFVAEDFVAETYNLDAVIKKIPDKAIVPKSTQNASPDIIYNDDKSASLKFYKDATSSAKAQLNPKYKNQTRIIPSDQVNSAKEELDKIINKNIQKNRFEAAESQEKTKDLISNKIIGDNEVESTPLSKQDGIDLAEAVSKNGDNIEVNIKKIDDVMKRTGVKANSKTRS